MTAISNWDAVPAFQSEVEEADYWKEHRLEMRLMDSSMVAVR